MYDFLTKAIFFFLLLSLTGAGCSPKPPAMKSSRPPVTSSGYEGQSRQLALMSSSIFQVSQSIAIQLKQNLRGAELSDLPCFVTTFVDIDNLQHSTRFGRVLAESVGSELFRQGADLKDVRPAKALYLQPGTGELILSRVAQRLASSIGARAVVTGTYSDGSRSVVVNVRLIDLYNGKILSVAGEEIAKTEAVRALLGTEPSPEETEAEPTTYDTEPL